MLKASHTGDYITRTQEEGNSIGDQTESQELHLPSNEHGDELYVLERWKVKDGTLVREGETVALACLESAKPVAEDSPTALTVKPGNASEPVAVTAKHKRPSRRKRPAAAPASQLNASTGDTNGKAQELRNIKLPKLKLESNQRESEENTSDPNNKSETSSESSKKSQQSTPIIAPITGFVRYGGKNNTPKGKQNKTIGFIKPCSHPAVVDGLCGVCGDVMPTKIPANESANTGASETNSQSTRGMSQVTVSGGLTFTVSEQEGIQIGRQNAKRLQELKRLSLVLDLDHTIVHAIADTRARSHLGERDDVRSLLLPVSEEIGNKNYMQHFAKLRPHVKEFLTAVMGIYEVGVYTAGTRKYAEQIVTVLCRHLVGAKRDLIELDQMRYKVSRAEADYKSQKREAAAYEAKTPPSQQDDGGAESNEHDNKEDHPTKKRRVTFAVQDPDPEVTRKAKLAEQAKKISLEQVNTMKAELKEAENLEQEALNMRKRLFGSRIVSRSDVGDLGRDVKSLKRIFPCGGTMAAVVDDREDVWANAKDNNSPVTSNATGRLGEPPENLLLVKPYHWQPFLGFADINNASGIDLTEGFEDKAANSDSASEKDIQLLWTADILKRLHARFYDQNLDDNENIKTVPEILCDMRKEVLRGEKIVLSGLVPLHKQNQEGDTRKPRPTIVRYVESLGASLLPSVQRDTSIVVAAKDGTDKILTARRIPKCSVVKVSWLMECFWSITKRDPKLHLLASTGRDTATAAIPSKPAGVSSAKAHGVNGAALMGSCAKATERDGGDDTDDEDDELAAEFEEDFM